MTSVVTQQIIEQLKDDSHPPIVLLDGDWGIGKTHLIENELKPLVETDVSYFGDFHYLSAYGLSKVTEFQDQVASLFLTNHKEGSSVVNGALKHVSTIAKAFGADNSEAGLIQGLMSGASGMVRQGTLNNLSNMTIVLDDLERINDQKLIADILGTCLRFAEHNKLKIVIVANSKAIADNTKLEKTFSDIIKLTRTTNELVNIVKEHYGSSFDPVIEEALTTIIEKVKIINPHINNLRVLKRIVNRICKLRKRIDAIDGIDTNTALRTISHQISGICLYAYAKEYKESDITDFFDKCTETLDTLILEKISDSEGTDNKEFSQKQVRQEFNTVFGWHNSTVSKIIIHYCFSNLIPDLSDEEFIKQLSLPRLTSPIDKLNNLYLLTEEEFAEGVDVLEKLLFNTQNADYYDWVTGCDTYLFLIENNYVEKEKSQIISALKASLAQRKTIDPSSLNNSGGFRRRLRLNDDLRSEEFKSLLQNYIEDAKHLKDRDFAKLFYADWQTAVLKTNQVDYNFEPLFHYFEQEELLKSILHWSPSAIDKFITFIKGRNNVPYPIIHKTEFPFLDSFIPLLEAKIADVEEKIRKGVLTELSNELKVSLDLGQQTMEQDKT